ncbi:Arm DNA-binding domain-containing protein [Nitrosomonas communis]|uniref:Integrase DNA-binding domain-containing protein n=1 Tax=Nitrosomonas communis TaxID=44574 RepID=A0A1I4V7Y3_9PROT|nr:Arm DNA-binding domain-containing protein [Nitrosomonas communis]SFM97326.1 protein of unknown function [Nitrosomonas communis]
MKRKNFSATAIKDFKCEQGKTQTLFWDAKSPGLGLRVTINGNKSYIFETKLHGKTLRMTIGNIKSWPLGNAQKEAMHLRVLTDQGIDPRQLAADKKAADEAKRKKEQLGKVSFGEVWIEYIDERKPLWSEQWNGLLHPARGTVAIST